MFVFCRTVLPLFCHPVQSYVPYDLLYIINRWRKILGNYINNNCNCSCLKVLVKYSLFHWTFYNILIFKVYCTEILSRFSHINLSFQIEDNIHVNTIMLKKVHCHQISWLWHTFLIYVRWQSILVCFMMVSVYWTCKACWDTLLIQPWWQMAGCVDRTSAIELYIAVYPCIMLVW